MKKLKFTSLVCTALIASTLVTGCAQDISSNTYSAASVGEAAYTYRGVITNVRVVTVKHSETLEGNQTGMLLGAVAGGFLGNQVGGGKGRTAATVGGAVLGAAAGAGAEQKLKTQQAYEYTVRTNEGQNLTVVQGLDSSFAIGQKVMVIVSHKGRSRVVSDV